MNDKPIVNPDWFGLTMYAPYDSLWLRGIKIYETRPRRVVKTLPLKLFIQTAKQPMNGHRQSLADKYLAQDYEPNYGKIIGYCLLTATTLISEELIEDQTPEELEMGNWKVGRFAWQALERVFLAESINFLGIQTAPWQIKPDLKEEIISKNKLTLDLS